VPPWPGGFFPRPCIGPKKRAARVRESNAPPLVAGTQRVPDARLILMASQVNYAVASGQPQYHAPF
jgi:hypothetical protein